MLARLPKYNYGEIVFSKTSHSLKSVYGLNFLVFCELINLWQLCLFSSSFNRKNKYVYKVEYMSKLQYVLCFQNFCFLLSFLASHFFYFEQLFFFNKLIFKGIYLNIDYLWSIKFYYKIFDLKFFIFYVYSLLCLLLILCFSFIFIFFFNLRKNFIKC
jgi:hypothetical protein